MRKLNNWASNSGCKLKDERHQQASGDWKSSYPTSFQTPIRVKAQEHTQRDRRRRRVSITQRARFGWFTSRWPAPRRHRSSVWTHTAGVWWRRRRDPGKLRRHTLELATSCRFCPFKGSLDTWNSAVRDSDPLTGYGRAFSSGRGSVFFTGNSPTSKHTSTLTHALCLSSSNTVELTASMRLWLPVRPTRIKTVTC